MKIVGYLFQSLVLSLELAHCSLASIRHAQSVLPPTLVFDPAPLSHSQRGPAWSGESHETVIRQKSCFYHIVMATFLGGKC